jgi:hypothetical protein
MTAPSAIRLSLWFLSTLLALALPAAAPAQNRPITIPPATQITPPVQPPASPVPAPALAGIAPAPRALLPTGVEIVRDPLGAGIVMFGQLTGKADSALAVVSAIFAYSQAFDPIPAPLLAVADKNDHSAQVLFAATVHGATILGVAVVALSDSGGNVSVFYDYPGSFPASFPRLQQALAPGGASAGLISLPLADGTTIGIAPGWRVTGQGKGVVDLAGTQGELMTLGDTIPVYDGPTPLAGSVAQGQCCDPEAALRAAFTGDAAAAQRRGSQPQLLTGIVVSAEAPPPTGGQAAFILANLSVGGSSYSYLALAEAIGGFTNPWTLRLSGVMAPQPVFAAELPALLQIWGSYSGNPQGFAEHLNQAAQSIDALRPMLPSPVSATPTTVYRADGGWNNVIDTVVTHPGAAGSNPVDEATTRTLLDRLAKDSGGPWHAAPLPPH